eukprot:GHVU01204556.1.p1 GENE.GHVU01204556.1~~GHVU01204556.1.p1  ORF type:complete len:143 (-),score=4.63 GHVU01204556.1:3357-3785(-)
MKTEFLVKWFTGSCEPRDTHFKIVSPPKVQDLAVKILDPSNANAANENYRIYYKDGPGKPWSIAERANQTEFTSQAVEVVILDKAGTLRRCVCVDIQQAWIITPDVVEQCTFVLPRSDATIHSWAMSNCVFCAVLHCCLRFQ